MKVKCPVCGIEGFEKRGPSVRILHHKGFIDGKRVYQKHSIDSQMGITTVGIKELNLGSDSEKGRGCRLAWSRLVDLGSIDPGPNPGSPTTENRVELFFRRMCVLFS